MVKEKDEDKSKSTMESTIPMIKGEGIVSSFQDEPNQNFSLNFFIEYCVNNGFSVRQVLKAVINKSLIMLSTEGKKVQTFSYLSEKNLESYLRESNISFPALHADFFWRHTQPDHMGGWKVQDGDNPISSSIQKDSEEYERAKNRTIPEQRALAKQKKKEGFNNWQIAQFVLPHKVKEVKKGSLKKASLLRQVRRRLE